MQDQISQAVSMVAIELFHAPADKMSDTILEREGNTRESKHPIYFWVDSNGNQGIRTLISVERITSEELTHAMYTIGSKDPMTQDDIHDVFGEIANVIGGNLKSVVEDIDNLMIPQVSLNKPWISGSPSVSLTLNWRGKFLVVSISDLALGPQDRQEGNVHIVVADDSRVTRQVVVRTLYQAGFDWRVMEAEDGIQILQLTLNEAPSLIFSDWNISNMLGIGMLQQLRASGSKIPIGFVTSEGSPQMRGITQQAGVGFLIQKSFDAATFEQILGAFNR